MLDVPRDYVRLGLRFDRLVDGFVDAYFGDPAVKAEVAAEPTPDPVALGKEAARLREALADCDLGPERSLFLDGQLAGLEVSARKLAGEEIGFVEEVESYFQVRIAPADESTYADAHALLDDALGGSGSLAERYAAYRVEDELPPARLEEAMHAFSSALRDRTRERFGLPEVETVDYEVVSDKPWSGFNYYLGNHHSKVAVNSDLPARKSDLPHLIAHESYPGHHTEHSRKETLLVDEAGWAEHAIFLVNTPECLMAEGLADLGLRVAVGSGWGAWAQEVYADLGVPFDGERAERIAKAAAALLYVRQDAAIMLHDRGRPEEEAIDYLVRWGLAPAERARQSLRFMTDPLWRAYTSTYVEGYVLLGRWLDAGEERTRFARLLDEPLTPATLQADLAD